MKQIAPRISDRCTQMLDALTEHFEGQRIAVEKLIEDGYRKYIGISDLERLRAGATGVPCASCGKPIDPESRWMPGHFGEAYCKECIP